MARNSRSVSPFISTSRKNARVSPVMLASGTVSYGEELSQLCDLSKIGGIVPKAWGYEWCAWDSESGDAAVWVLHIAKGRRTSLHRHPNKRTTLVCLTGHLQVKVGDQDTLGADNAMATGSLVYKSLAYDVQRDFTPVSRLVSFPLVFAVPASLPVNSLPAAQSFNWKSLARARLRLTTNI